MTDEIDELPTPKAVFEKFGVRVSERDGMCLVHIVFGRGAQSETQNAVLEATRAGIIASLGRAGIYIEEIYKFNTAKEPAKKNGSAVYLLDDLDYYKGRGPNRIQYHDGETVSFYVGGTTPKDYAKKALTVLHSDFPLSGSKRELLEKVDKAFKNERGKK